MSEALIQIVDENDKPLRGGTMDEVQLAGLWHRIVRVMIEDRAGNILLQRRRDDDFYMAGMWDNSVSGHVDCGEEYEQAALRERAEEIGIKTGNLQMVAKYRAERVDGGRTYRRFNCLYRQVVDSDLDVHPDLDELAEARWFTPTEFAQLCDDGTKVTSGLRYIHQNFYTSGVFNR